MATATAAAPGAIVPAQLGFLAIFNPCLGETDDTLDDQIVYYASESMSTQNTKNTKQARHAGNKKRRTRGRPTDAISQEERNERLRQIGLAQALITFSRGFADGASLDSVDTEKSRIVTHELEPGWWILASISFTQLPLPPRLPVKTAKEEQEIKYEYSSREVKPASLLLRDLLRAHSTFLLHHDTSLSSLFVRKRRTKFVAAIGRYWDLFLSTWTVMLHGNPARNIFGGINVAVSGELGVGVGEEQRGSGEREVLEGLVGRIEGLVDLVVSKFGTDVDVDADADAQADAHAHVHARENAHDAKGYREQQAGLSPPPPRWLGTGEEPAAEDGAIFLGVGALSRKSLRDLTHWMEDLYQWGDHAYGVIESPTSSRRARARVPRGKKSIDETPSATRKNAPKDQAQKKNERPAGDKSETEQNIEEQQKPEAAQVDQDQEALATSAEADTHTNAEAPLTSDTAEPQDGKLDKMLSYMKLGYGSYWTIPGKPLSHSDPHYSTAAATSTTSTTSITTSKPSQETTSPPPPPPPPPPRSRPHSRPYHLHRTISETQGYYLIGLRGSIEDDLCGSGSDSSDSACSGPDIRTVVRTVNVELEHKPATRADVTFVRDFQHPSSVLAPSQVAGSMVPGYFNSHDLNKSEKLRVVVYVNRPFIFTFLFRLHTDSLAWPSLYRSLHHQLSPLKKPLFASTAYRPDVAAAADSRSTTNNNIYNLVWDPPALTIHSTIPNIPDAHACDDDGVWSRADAISSHLHLLTVHAHTRFKHTDLERHQKTNRGWWITWTRLLDRTELVSSDTDDDDDDDAHTQTPHRHTHQDASENETDPPERHQPVSKEIFLLRRASDHVGLADLTPGDTGRASDRASNLVQGIGLDTRRYVEDLLSFL
ncbi:hypothetical protein E4U21_004054 [Claviceps maximensis]|nr:hypothetical protein E4U21_004054 [Claviceps maximensis]